MRVRDGAAATAVAAREGAIDRLRQECLALEREVTEHLRLVNQLLASLARRRLAHDHHRLMQLTRALELATDDDELQNAAVHARTIEELMRAHEERELGAM